VSARDGLAPFEVTLQFHGDLTFFLTRRASNGRVVRALGEKTSVKDVIESCGVPHTEVDAILCGGVPCGFEFQLTSDVIVDVHSSSAALGVDAAHRLQRARVTRFVLDGHLGKLARMLRLLGFDTIYRPDAEDRWLVQIAVEERRALITRDRRLLMHAVLTDGYCPRSLYVDEQTIEMMRRFDLWQAMQPYSRCLRCNGLLERVEKEAVLAQLEPLTQMHYTDFRRCAECRQVYWSGSHFSKLEARVKSIRSFNDQG
jgi:uncharacterized protein